MGIHKTGIPSHEITPEHIFAERRKFIKKGVWAFSATASAALLAACGAQPPAAEKAAVVPIKPQSDAAPQAAATATTAPVTAATAAKAATEAPASAAPAAAKPPASADELGNALTPIETISNYNNYYEFTSDKEAVAGLATNFKTGNWKVKISGQVR